MQDEIWLDCTGGGTIKHSDSKIFLYGESKEFGKADHENAGKILKKEFIGYKI